MTFWSGLVFAIAGASAGRPRPMARVDVGWETEGFVTCLSPPIHCAFTAMLVSFILPAVFFLAVHWRALSWLRTALCAGVVLLGFAGMAVGLTNTLSGV